MLPQAEATGSSCLYITGATQKDKKLDEWKQFKSAFILHLDTDNQAVRSMTYESPQESCPSDDPSILFKSGHVEGNDLYVCTSTELLVYELPQFHLKHYISIPAFNDLHHVRPTPHGSLLAVNTGLDMVVEVALDGRISREFNVLGEPPWDRFSREVDYRKIASTKPHASHPNYVFYIADDIWVTRFYQKDAMCLTKPGLRIDFGRTPHDGVASYGRLYFTSVDGYVFIVNATTLQTEKTVNLNEITGGEAPLGWCRGILPVDERCCWIGFSRFRPTKFKQHLSWIRHGFRHQSLPTRIGLFDLNAHKLLKEIDLEPYGMNVVFSMFPAPAVAGAVSNVCGAARKITRADLVAG